MQTTETDIKNNVFKVGNVSVGGRSSAVPTVLIGSIFYMRHKIVLDAQKGIFDEEKTAEIIEGLENTAAKCGVSYMLDVVGNTPEAMLNYMAFLKKHTAAPCLLNSTVPEVRLQSVRLLSDKGLIDNVIYNSINAFSTEEELQVLADSDISTSIVQAYNLGSKKPDGPLKALIGSEKKEGMLSIAKRCGIDNVMVDIPTLDMSSVGLIVHSAQMIKDETGLACGTASSNATYASKWLRNKDEISTEQFRAVDASVNSYLAGSGFNFLLYGPVEGYKWVMPSVAVINGLNLYGARHLGAKALTPEHPISKVL